MNHSGLTGIMLKLRHFQHVARQSQALPDHVRDLRLRDLPRDLPFYHCHARALCSISNLCHYFTKQSTVRLHNTLRCDNL
jgi:hypothetical protein